MVTVDAHGIAMMVGVNCKLKIRTL